MKYHWWTLVYVFDATATEGREFKRRMPRFLAELIIKRSNMRLDLSYSMDEV